MQVGIMEDDILSGYLKRKHCYKLCLVPQRMTIEITRHSKIPPWYLSQESMGFLKKAWADISFSCVGGQPSQQKYGFLNMPVSTLCQPLN